MPGAAMNPLAAQLGDRIRREGPLPFAEFMRAALYDPVHGYYARAEGQIGKRGDFMTSVSVGPLFGELLAFQFARWLESARQPDSEFQIVEVGAHDGQLARDILEDLEEREPTLFRSIEYWIIEPSPARRTAQEVSLARFRNVRWFAHPSQFVQPVTGIIFSNELLDAMPVHPFAWNAGAQVWEEMGVTLVGQRFTWTRMSQASTSLPILPAELLAVLPDGYLLELAPLATQWWRGAAAALGCGHLMTIDYGGETEELLSPARTSGTLRAYSRHRVGPAVLANPGEQDITAHVNFTEIIRAGESAGLRTETFTSQSQFLTTIARELWTRAGSWPQEHVRQFQTLTHPEHLGRPFRVLVQSR
jgi:SAM-dependent MidA family methyltransferase